MGKNKPITFEERKEIERLLKTGMSISTISQSIGRSKNVGVVEVRRSGGRENYTALEAQRLAGERKDRMMRKATETCLKNLSNPYTNLFKRMEAIEMHMDIIMSIINKKEGSNG